MISFSSINGQKMHGSKYWITNVLKGELGCKGFVVSDWGGIDQLGSDYKQDVVASFKLKKWFYSNNLYKQLTWV